MYYIDFASESFQNRYEIEEERVTIKVMNKKTIGFDALVGQCDIDLYSIYLSPKHAIINEWMALTNKDIDYNKITGYIKLSFQVLRNDDKRNNLQKLAEDSSEPQIILPPQIKRSGH